MQATIAARREVLDLLPEMIRSPVVYNYVRGVGCSGNKCMPEAEGCFFLGMPHCSPITLHKAPADFHILDPLSITKGGLEWKQYAGHFIFKNALVFPYTEKNLPVL